MKAVSLPELPSDERERVRIALLVGWVGMLVATSVILVHHACKHEELPWPDRCMQPSDMCNFRSWNHETFAIATFILTLVFLALWVAI